MLLDGRVESRVHHICLSGTVSQGGFRTLAASSLIHLPGGQSEFHHHHLFPVEVTEAQSHMAPE